MIRRLFICGAVLALACGSVTMARADSQSDEKKEGYQESSLKDKVFHKARLYLDNKDKLGLTDEQVATIKNLKQDLKKVLIMKAAELDVVALDLKTVLAGDNFDVNEAKALIDEKYELKKAEKKFIIETYARLKGVLTDVQKQKLKELWKK